ncbi:hypothetical protein ACW9KT_20020 [Hymenobacter sp. HD11105]
MSWVFALVVFIVGVLNILLVHPVPGVVYLLFSLIYLPPAQAVLRQKLGVSIPWGVKIILALLIIQFTLGVSDLGDLIDDQNK